MHFDIAHSALAAILTFSTIYAVRKFSGLNEEGRR